MKHGNISAALEALGYPYIDGYKPYGHSQSSVIKQALQPYLPEIDDILGRKSIARENGEMPVNKTVESLLRRSYGGNTAAVVPGASVLDDLPKTQPPAGVVEIMAFLLRRLTDTSLTHGPEWVFLVGGPGNGKSFQLVKLLECLRHEQQLGPSDLAPRGFDIKLSGRNLRVVNDASIPETDSVHAGGGPGSLALDLRRCLQDDPSPHLLVNINRGVMVEELAALRDIDGWQAEFEAIEWLAAESDYLVGPPESYLDRIDVGRGSDYFRHAVLNAGSVRARLHAVFLDRLSLFELLPGGEGPAVAGLDSPNPVSRPYTLVKLNDSQRLQSPAGRLVAQVIQPALFEDDSCDSCHASIWCPFLANVRTLRDDAVRQGYLQLLRGAEVASGRLFTFRDLWGLICTSIVGARRPEWLDPATHPCAWVQGQVANLGVDNTRKVRIRTAIQLSQQRLHYALFPTPIPAALGDYSVPVEAATPAGRSLVQTDPVRDISPLWAEPVSAAMEGTAFQIQPGASLAKGNQCFASAWQPLDAELDSLQIGWRRPDDRDWSERDRRNVVSWQAKALYRLFGISNGHFAHEEAVLGWLELRHIAGKGPVMKPTKLSQPLKELLLPPSEFLSSRDWALLPIFHARTEPVRGPRDDYTWCSVVGTNSVDLEVEAFGDSLWLVLKDSRNQQQVARVQVDIAMCREALASSAGPGFTEQGGDAAPKLERARASFIADGRIPPLLVLVQAGCWTVEIEESV